MLWYSQSYDQVSPHLADGKFQDAFTPKTTADNFNMV